MEETSFEGMSSDKSMSRRRMLGLTGAALTSATLASFLGPNSEAQAQVLRALQGQIQITGKDDENWPFPHELVDVTRTVRADLGVDQPAVKLPVEPVGWGGECRVEVDLWAHALTDGTIQLMGQVRFYEGTDEGPHDLEDWRDFAFPVPRNTRTNPDPAQHEIHLVNVEEGGDWAHIFFKEFFNRIVEE
jgi:hypothetical protein